MATQSSSVRDQLADFQRFMGNQPSNVRSPRALQDQHAMAPRSLTSFLFSFWASQELVKARSSSTVRARAYSSDMVFTRVSPSNAVLCDPDTKTAIGTKDLTVHSFWYQGKHVHLMDTPGFDDTETTDIETLKTIAGYLSASYANGVRINGIVYLHRISDYRLSGTSSRNLRMFKKVTSAKAWPNTIVGTTMWRADEHLQGELRERELASDSKYIGDLLTAGAGLHRIAEHGTGAEEQKRSSLALLTSLLRRIQTRPTIELEIQREMAVDKLSLDDTAAGQEALGNIYQLRLQLASQVADAIHQMQDAMQAQDLQAAHHLQDFKLQCATKIDDAQRQQDELKTSLMELHDRETQKLQSKLDKMADEQSEALRRKEQELRDMQESLRDMRKQSAVDEARWKRQRLHARELEKKRRDARKINEACEQDVAALKSEVVQNQETLSEIKKTKGAMRQDIINGLANGGTAGVATAAAAVGEFESKAC
jgi:hypothetical protein